MATSFGLGDEPVIIGEDIVTQEDVQKAVRGAGYLGNPSYTQEDVQRAVTDAGYLDLGAPPEFSRQGALAQLEADLMQESMVRDQLREEELLGQQNLKTVNTIPPVSKEMSNTDKVLNTILKHEGGFQISSKDKGNYNSAGDLVGTNFGISAPVYEKYIGKSPSVSDMKNITEDEAREIYKKSYITPVTKNLGIPPESDVFEQVVDMAVNHGYRNAVRITQRAIGNIKDDGKAGPITKKAILKAIKDNPIGFNNSLVNSRSNFYKQIVNKNPSQQEFIKGWLDRASSFIK